MQDQQFKTFLPDLSQAERYLYYALLFGIGLSLFSALDTLRNYLTKTASITGEPPPSIYSVLLRLALAFLLVFFIFLIHKGKMQFAVQAACISGIGAMTAAATSGGLGMRDPVYVFTFVILIVSAAFIGSRGLNIAWAASMLAVTFAFCFDRSQFSRIVSQPPRIASLAVYLSALSMAAIILRITIIRLVEQAKALNNQTKELEISRNALRTHQSHLEDVVEARTAELSEEKIRAEEANRAKSLFLTNMSHELRTPLNAIIGYSEIIAEESEIQEMEDFFLEDAARIGSAGRHLLGLINSLLDLSKIESDQFDLEFSQVNIDKLLEDIEAIARPVIEKNNNRFIMDVKNRPTKFVSDQARVRQILLNLIGNAAKFTSDGSITLEVDSDDNKVTFAVSDTGIGIKPDFLPRIFDQFSQADLSSSRRYDGTGLGLAITKKLCILLGGDISATSQVNQGSQFTVELPLISDTGYKRVTIDSTPSLL